MQLCPAQQRAFDTILCQRSRHQIFELHSPLGNGCSTVLWRLYLALGGVLLQMQDAIAQRHPKHSLGLATAFEQWVMTALTQHSAVLIDDMHLLHQHVLCSHDDLNHEWLDLALLRCSNYAEAVNKTLILGYCSDYGVYSPLSQRACQVEIEPFQETDYAFFCQYYLDSAIAATLNYDHIFRSASNLNGYQLKNYCLQLQQNGLLIR